MKIAIISESRADEAAVEVLVRTIVGPDFVREEIRNLRAPGWTAIPRIVPLVLRTLYFRPEADGLVVVLDANGSAIHNEGKETTEECDVDCRLCTLCAIARRELARLTQLPARKPLRFAVGLAVPTIEAWLLSQRQSGLTEAMIKVARQEGRPYSRIRLKELLYGTSRPTLEEETAKMVEQMKQIVKDLARLRTAFPGGFGPLYDEIASWKRA